MEGRRGSYREWNIRSLCCIRDVCIESGIDYHSLAKVNRWLELVVHFVDLS